MTKQLSDREFNDLIRKAKQCVQDGVGCLARVPLDGWGPMIDSSVPDPWSTAQGIYALCRANHHVRGRNPIPGLAEKCRNAATFLKTTPLRVGTEGARASVDAGAYRDSPSDSKLDVATTAWVAFGLQYLRDYPPAGYVFDADLVAMINESLGWVNGMPLKSGGWPDYKGGPNPDPPPFNYATAFAIKGLATLSVDAGKTPPPFETRPTIGGGIHHFFEIRELGRGWANVGKRGASEPTFTAYCLDAIFDAVEFHGTELRMRPLRQALVWLMEKRAEDGFWSGESSIVRSGEATAYAIYVLLRAGLNPRLRFVEETLDPLLSRRTQRGGWRIDLDETQSSESCWVTMNVLVALTEFLLRAE